MIKHDAQNARFAGKPVRIVNAVTGVETEEVIIPGMTTRNLCEQLKISQRVQGNINVRNGKAGEYFGLNDELYPQIQRGTELYVFPDPEYGGKCMRCNHVKCPSYKGKREGMWEAA